MEGVLFMSQTTLNVRIDENVKKELEKFCYEVGLNVSVAVNMFARNVVREQRLPFDVSLNTPNDTTFKAIDDARKRNNLSKPFYSVDELMDDLNTDD